MTEAGTAHPKRLSSTTNERSATSGKRLSTAKVTTSIGSNAREALEKRLDLEPAGGAAVA